MREVTNREKNFLTEAYMATRSKTFFVYLIFIHLCVFLLILRSSRLELFTNSDDRNRNIVEHFTNNIYVKVHDNIKIPVTRNIENQVTERAIKNARKFYTEKPTLVSQDFSDPRDFLENLDVTNFQIEDNKICNHTFNHGKFI